MSKFIRVTALVAKDGEIHRLCRLVLDPEGPEWPLFRELSAMALNERTSDEDRYVDDEGYEISREWYGPIGEETYTSIVNGLVAEHQREPEFNAAECLEFLVEAGHSINRGKFLESGPCLMTFGAVEVSG